MIDLLNPGSLVLGLIAWILPVVNLKRYKQHDHKNWFAFSIISISACATSLCFQLLNNYHLVIIEDWSALLDTMGAVVYAAATLLSVTIILNVITLIVYRDKTTR